MVRGRAVVEVNPSDQCNCNDRLDKRQVEKPAPNSLEGTSEGQQVRNATGDQVEAIRAANPDAHNGSATPKDRAWLHKQALIEEQSTSLELFEDDKLIAARVMEAARPAVILKESLEQQSHTIEELTREVEENPLLEMALGLRLHAERLPLGEQKDKLIKLSRDEAEELRALFRQATMPAIDQEACGSYNYHQESSVNMDGKSYEAASVLAYNNVPSYQINDAANAVAKLEPTKEENRIAQNYNIEYAIERAKQTGIECSHKVHDGHDAKNNEEFLDMFLAGSGNDKQLHTQRGDPALEQFIKSPGAQAMREQYVKLGCPSSTDKLGYSTKQAFVDTVFKPALDSAKHRFEGLFDDRHLGNVATQVGGFGNPPKEYPWCTASATRCNGDAKPDASGKFVKFNMINVAGMHSWALHALPDRPMGSQGPYRSIVQVFTWVEPIESKANGK